MGSSPLTNNRDLVGCKWYKTKFFVDRKLEKHKACLVAKGFLLKEGINQRLLFQLLVWTPLDDYSYSCFIELGGSSNGCQKFFLHGDLQ